MAAESEAVEFHRRLAAARPDTSTADLAGALINLAGYLSDFGQHEDALASAREAIDIHRRLAVARPEVFTPELAGSLNNLAFALFGLGRHEEALAAAGEAVELLSPFFLALPRAHVDWMRKMASIYLYSCEAAGREPSDKLLMPIVAVLERLDAETT